MRPIDGYALYEKARGFQRRIIIEPYTKRHVERGFEIDDVLSAIGEAPTLDVEPVRHGRWEYKFYPTVWYGPGEPPEWICSVCEDRSYNTYDFCPNCGAKMYGGEADG